MLRNGTNMYIPVTKVVSSSSNPLKVAIRHFLKGTHFSQPFSEEVDILRVQRKENVAVLNLSQEFTTYTPELEEGVVKALALTATEIKNVEKVQLLIEGNPKVLPDGTDLNELLDRPAFAKIKLLK